MRNVHFIKGKNLLYSFVSISVQLQKCRPGSPPSLKQNRSVLMALTTLPCSSINSISFEGFIISQENTCKMNLRSLWILSFGSLLETRGAHLRMLQSIDVTCVAPKYPRATEQS